MTLEQLRIFVAVAEELHFTRAARRLNLTQPAVSAAIASLEGGRQVKLFHRLGKTVVLSDAGALFLPEVRDILRRVEDAQVMLDDLSSLRRGSVRAVASQTVGTYWLPERLERFARLHRGVHISMEIGNTEVAVSAVIAGEAELGIVEGPVEDDRLSIETVAEDHLILVVGSGHPWWGKTEIDPSSFGESDWITREPGSGTRWSFEQAIRAVGVDPASLSVLLTLQSGEAIRSALRGGGCAAVLSALVVKDDVAEGRLWDVGFPLPKRSFRLIRHRERYESAATKALADSLRGEGGFEEKTDSSSPPRQR